MRQKIISAAAIFASVALLASCAQTPVAEPPSEAESSAESQSSLETESSATAPSNGLTPAEIMEENADYTVFNTDEWEEADAVDINLSGGLTSTNVEGVAMEDAQITITSGGVYRLAGSFDSGVVVAAPDAEVVLILDGATISNTTGAAIEVESADDVAIHLAPGSHNSVSDAATYSEDADVNAAISADTDLTISGSGSLTVAGNGGHGIKSTDDLVILDGEITVTAAEDALRGKDALVVEGGTLTLTSTNGDGMKSKGDDGATDIDWTTGYVYVSGGSIGISAGDDGIQAFTDTVISGGSITLSAVDDGVKGEVTVSIGEEDGISPPNLTIETSNEGIEAANVGISGGTTSVVATDDGLNASGNTELQSLIAGETVSETAENEPQGMPGGGGSGERLEITGGTLVVDAEGDGLDSNGTLTFSGGNTTVYGPTAGGNGSLDSEGGLTISGGTLLTFGPNSMEQVPGTDGQAWVLVVAELSAGQTAQLVDDSGAVVAEFTSKKNARNIIFSSPDIVAGATYSVTSDGASLGSAIAGEGGTGGMGGMGGGGRRADGGTTDGGTTDGGTTDGRPGTPPEMGERPAGGFGGEQAPGGEAPAE